MNNTFLEIEKEIVPILCEGGIGVFPTDTLYGLVASAFNKNAVERVYAVRRRELDKPFIILLSSIDDLEQFGIKLNNLQLKKLNKFWPGKISFIFPCNKRSLEYLHRGKKSLAFRYPKDKLLLELLKKIGPLIAPSANIAGKEPATTFAEAKKYFGNEVDFYVDYGQLLSKPSTLAEVDEQGNMKVLREGAVKLI